MAHRIQVASLAEYEGHALEAELRGRFGRRRHIIRTLSYALAQGDQSAARWSEDALRSVDIEIRALNRARRLAVNAREGRRRAIARQLAEMETVPSAAAEWGLAS